MQNDKRDNGKWQQRVLGFSIGILATLIIALLLGAAVTVKNPTLGYGRYQLSSFATQISEDSAIVGAFMVDTASGETKTVYMRTFGKPPKSTNTKLDLKKPFSAIP